MKIEGSVALVTGANRGLGLAYAKALLAAGAAKVYAGARDPASVKEPGLIPVQLDVNDPRTIAEAVKQCGDVSILVNNAGIARAGSLLSKQDNEALRALMDTNFYGVLALTQAFAPVLAKNGGGAVVNMLSALSWISLPDTGGYSVSKAAAWALTNGLRHELHAQNTLVVAVHAGYIDTDMVAHVTDPKIKPETVAQRTVEAIAAGREEVLADETSQQVKAGFNGERPAYLGAPLA
jgi:NAD(P)-dependent dehydrogenase (short-subunit alcohol dehydrogenase family)